MAQRTSAANRQVFADGPKTAFSMTELIRYNNAKKALALVHRVDEVKSIRDKAVAMQVYAKQAKDRDLIGHATDIRLRAECRAGELLAEMARHGKRVASKDTLKKGRGKQRATTEPKLSDLGVSKTQSSRWQKLAALSAKDFEQRLDYVKRRQTAVLDGTNYLNPVDGDDEWHTPPEFVERVRRALGKIDLDPASNATAQRTVKSARYFTRKDNALTCKWRGRVFLNPPYSKKESFIDKLLTEVAAGRVTGAVLLTHNNTQTEWWQRAAKAASALCFPCGKIKFTRPDGTVGIAPALAQVFTFFGGDVARFAGAFADAGLVVVPDPGRPNGNQR
jgi:phage N-6-adenine-methyltransferase